MTAIVAGQGLGLINTSLGLLGEQGQLGVAGQGRSGEKVAVNAANGNLVIQQQDEWLVGVGADLIAQRTYNSLAAGSDDDNGDNWRLGYSRRIVGSSGAPTVTRVAEDGLRQTFTQVATNTYQCKQGSGSYDTLVWNGSTTWTWTDGDSQTKEVYQVQYGSSDYLLTSITDLDGLSVTLTYDATTRLITQIKDSNNEYIKVEYDTATKKNITSLSTYTSVNAQITQAKRVTYTYDTNTPQQRLQRVVVDLTPGDAGDSQTYATEYSYDGNSNRIKTLKQGTLAQLLANQYNSLLSFDYVDVNGSMRIWRVTESVSGQPLTTQFSYDTVAGTTTVTDANSNQTVLSYDVSVASVGTPKEGTLLSIKQPVVNGADLTTRFTYDANGNVETVTDASGNQITYGYDANGNRTYERDGRGNVVERTFSSKNQLLTQTGYTVPAGTGLPSGATTSRYVYDTDANGGHLRFAISPLGNVTEYVYFTGGNGKGQLQYSRQYANTYSLGSMDKAVTPTLTNMTDWVASSAVDKTQQTLVEYAYDFRGQLSKQIAYNKTNASGASLTDDNLQVVTQYFYDQAGNLLKKIDSRADEALTRNTDWARNLRKDLGILDGQQNGKLAESLSTSEKNTIAQYAAYTTTYTYDGLNRITKQTDAQVDGQKGTITTVSVYDDTVRTTTVYKTGSSDANSKLIEVATSVSTYDEAGHLLSLAYTNNKNQQAMGTTKYTYDKLNRLISVEVPATLPSGVGEKSYYLYDEASRKIGEVNAEGALIEYRYNKNGQVSRTIAYDTLVNMGDTTLVGKLAGGTAKLSDLGVDTDGVDKNTWYVYDKAGRLLFTLSSSDSSYDTVGDGSGYGAELLRMREYAYDGLGRLVGDIAHLNPVAGSKFNQLKAFTGELSYDFSTKRIYMGTAYITVATIADDRATRYYYDADSRRIGELDAQNYYTQNEYDARGRLIARTRYATAVASVPSNGAVPTVVTAETAYSALGQDQITKYAYNNKGQLIGQLERAPIYNSANVYTGLGYLYTAYEYDGAGNRTKETRYETVQANTFDGTTAPTTSANDRVTTYTYDANNRLLSANTTPSGHKIAYAYDAAGNLASTTTTVHRGDGGSDDVRVRRQRYDALGRLTDELSAEGAKALEGVSGEANIQAVWDKYATKYVYNDAGRRIAMIEPNGKDGSGNKTVYYYDKVGRVTHTVNALGEVTQYQYDAFGQKTKVIQSSNRAGTPSALTGGLNSLFTAPGGSASAQTSYTYTRAGELSSVYKYGQGGLSPSDSQTYYYDALGNLIEMDTSLSATKVLWTLYGYDKRGLRTSTEEQLHTTTTTDGGITFTETTDSLRLTQNTFDAFGRAVTDTDGQGIPTETNYDNIGRVVQLKVPSGAGGATTTYTYDAFGRTLSSKDRSGLSTRYFYDDAAGEITVQTPESGLMYTSVNSAGQAVSSTDARGNKVTYSYDKDGRLTETRVLDTNGSTVLSRTQTRYDMAGRVKETEDSRGTITSLTYDKAGRVLSRTVDSASGGLALTTLYRYDAKGQAVWTRDANGTWTKTSYSKKGDVLTVVTDPAKIPSGTVAANEDKTGDDLSLDANLIDNPASGGALALETAYTYNAKGQTLTVTQRKSGDVSALLKTSYTYDALGRRDSETVDPGGKNLTTNYEYDKNNRVTKKTDAEQQVTRYVYDEEGRQRFMVDGNGALTQYTYDINGRLSQTYRFGALIVGGAAMSDDQITNAAAANANPSVDQVTTHIYDKMGRLKYVRDALGNLTQYDCDRNGNVIKTTRYGKQASPAPTVDAAKSVGLFKTYTIALGSLADATKDQLTRSYYDAANRCTWTLQYDYDASANPTQKVYATRYFYDPAGNVIETRRFANEVKNTPVTGTEPEIIGAGGTAPAGAYVLQDVDKDQVIYKAYDKANRLKFVIDGEGYVTQNDYDTLGNLKSSIRFANAATFGSGFAAGNEVSVLDVGAATTGLKCWVFKAKTTDVNQDRIASYGWDAAGRETTETVTDRAGQTLSSIKKAYDAVGHLKDVTDAYGTGQDVTTHYNYDSAGRLIEEIKADSAVNSTALKVTTRYVLDNLGQRKGIIDPRGVELAESDSSWATDMRKSLVDAGKLDSSYLNSCTTFSDAQKATLKALYTTTQQFDAQGRVIQIVDPLGGTTNTDYDAYGNAVRVQDPNGNYGHFVFDKNNQATWAIDPMGYATQTEYDALGQVTQITKYATVINNKNQLATATVAPMSPAEVTAYKSTHSGSAPTTPYLSSSAQDAVIKIEHDLVGHQTKITDALGFVESMSYDSQGNKISYTPKSRSGAVSLVNDANLTIDGTTVTKTGGSATLFDAAFHSSVGYVGGARVSFKVGQANKPLMLGLTATPTDSNSYDTIQWALYCEEDGRLTCSLGGQFTTLGVYAKDDVLSVVYDGKAVNFLQNGKVLKSITQTITQKVYADGSFKGALASVSDLVFDDCVASHTYKYDRRGLLTEEKMPEQVVKLDDQGKPVTGNVMVDVINKYGYDARGNRTQSVEASDLHEQRITNFKFDALNRQIEKTGEAMSIYTVDVGIQSAQVPKETTKYDARGNVIEIVAQNGQRTLSYYDNLNRKIGQLQGQYQSGVGVSQGALTRYIYDASGNLTKIRAFSTLVQLPTAAGGTLPADPLTGDVKETQYGYDANSRLIKTIVPNVLIGEINNATGNYEIHSQDLITQKSYDANGNVVTDVDARGNTVWHYHDAAGNEIATVDADRYLIIYTYDGAGHVASKTAYENQLRDGFVLGKDLSLIDLIGGLPNSSNRKTDWEIDKGGRISKQTVYAVESATVDAQAGILTTSLSSNAYTYFFYNGLGQLVQKKEATGDVLDWSYDAQGRETSKSGAAYKDYEGDTVRQVSIKTYDGLGNVETLTDKNKSGLADHHAWYYYGVNGLLQREEKEVSDSQNIVTNYQYDLAGAITSTALNRTDSDGAVSTDITTYAYDLAGRQVKQKVFNVQGANGKLLNSQTYTALQTVETRYNAYSQITGKRTYGNTAPTGDVWQEFAEYDAIGRTIKSNSGNGVAKASWYDANNNATMTVVSKGTDIKQSSLAQIVKLDDAVRTFQIFDRRNNLAETIQNASETLNPVKVIDSVDSTWQSNSNLHITFGPATSVSGSEFNPLQQGGMGVVAGPIKFVHTTGALIDGGARWCYRLGLTMPDTSALGSGKLKVRLIFVDKLRSDLAGYNVYQSFEFYVDGLNAGGFWQSPICHIGNYYGRNNQNQQVGSYSYIPYGVDIEKEGPNGYSYLAGQGMGAETWPEAFSAGTVTNYDLRGEVDISGQPAGTAKMIMDVRKSNTNETWRRVNPIYDDNNGSYFVEFPDVGTDGTYDVIYTALDAAGNVLNQERGSVTISAFSGTDITKMTGAASQSLSNGVRRVLALYENDGTTSGIINTGLKSGATVATVKFRKVNTATWSSDFQLSPAVLAGSVSTGVFRFVPATPEYNLTDTNATYEYVLSTKDGVGNVVERVLGEFKLNNADSVKAEPVNIANLPSTVHFKNLPKSAQSVRVLYRESSSSGNWSTQELSQANPGSFDWATFETITLNASSTYSVNYELQAFDAQGKLVHDSTGKVSLGATNKVFDGSTADAMPQADTLMFRPPVQQGAVPATMKLYYRSAGSSGPYGSTPLTATVNANGLFSFNASSLLPSSLASGVWDYYYEVFAGGGGALTSNAQPTLSNPGKLDLMSSAVPIVQTILLGTASASQFAHATQKTNAFGEVIEQVDALGRKTKLRYNSMGRLVEKDDPNATVTGADGIALPDQIIATKYYYDLQGRLLGTRDAKGTFSTLLLVNAGEGQSILSKEFHLGDGGIKRNLYDVFGDLRSVSSELSTSDTDTTYRTKYEYDRAHRLTKITRPLRSGASLGGFDLYTYDEAGHRIKHQTSADGTTSGEFFYTDTNRFDALGRMVYSYSAASRTVSYTYTYDADILGVAGAVVGGWKLLTTNSNAQNNTLQDYTDIFGHQTKHTDLGNRTFSYDYNYAGWLAKQSGAGQSIDYSYYDDGRIKGLLDNVYSSYTLYKYDLVGNKVYEGYAKKNGTSWAYYQQATISYDVLNRVVRIVDPQYRIYYEYDEVGNRRHLTAYKGSSQTATQNYWYDYDTLNRLTVSMGQLSGGVITRGTSGDGVKIEYDSAGNRKTVYVSRDNHREDYEYSNDGFLTKSYAGTSLTAKGALASNRISDMMGRVLTYSQTGSPDRTFKYDGDGKVWQDVSNGTTTTYIMYNDGTLRQTSSLTGSLTTYTFYTYEWWDDAKQKAITTTQYDPQVNQDKNQWKPGTSYFEYDVNGHANKVQDVVGKRTLNYSTNAQGLILIRDEVTDLGLNVSQVNKSQKFFYFEGARIGEVGNDASAANVDYMQALAQKPVDRATANKNLRPMMTSNFDQNYVPISPTYPGFTSAGYTVQADGVRLQDVAQAVWGDASLWYMLADANGLTSTTPLTKGQSLVIPNKVTNIHNNSTTKAVYNAAQAMGDTSPTLPPAPPPPPAKKGCGGAGAIVMVAVAIVATVVTAGALGPAMIAAMGPVLGSIATGAIAGAISSIASQGVGLATGTIDSFSWSGVAMGAIGGAVSGGISGVGASAYSGINLVGGLGSTANGIAQAALSNAITQGIGVATGLQKKFDWTGVAVSGISAGISQSIVGGSKGNTFDGFGKRLLAGGINGAVQSAAYDRKPNWASIAANSFGTGLGDAIGAAVKPAVDRFGSALGDAVVGSIQRADSAKNDDPLGDFIKQNEQKWAQVSPYPRSDEMPLTDAQKSAMAAGRGPRKADDAQAWADNSGYPQPVGATVEQIRVGQTRMWKMTTPDGQVSLSDRYPSAAERGDLPRDESLNPIVGTQGPRSAGQWDAFSPGLSRLAPDSVPTSGPSFFDQRVPFLADAIDFTKTGIERYAPKSTQGVLNFGLDMAVGDGTVGATLLLAAGPLAKFGRAEGAVGEGLVGKLWSFEPRRDIDLRGAGSTWRTGVDAAFERIEQKSGVTRDQFEVTKWGKTVEGKTVPVEWTGPRNAQVNLDIPNLQETRGVLPNGPSQPHIGWKAPGRVEDGRGHIFVDQELPATRPPLGVPSF